MTRKEYRRLEALLNKAVNDAIDDNMFAIANVLHNALNTVQDAYIWPDDLSTL